MQYERSEDGIDYVNAFPISIQEDADLMPLMERLLDKNSPVPKSSVVLSLNSP